MKERLIRFLVKVWCPWLKLIDTRVEYVAHKPGPRRKLVQAGGVHFDEGDAA